MFGRTRTWAFHTVKHTLFQSQNVKILHTVKTDELNVLTELRMPTK